jgi:hypothetical protein
MIKQFQGLSSIRSGPQFRDFMSALPDEACLAGVFDSCLSPIVYSRHHSLSYKGEYRVRADLRRELEELRERDPLTWDDTEADLLLSLLALYAGETGLDDLRDRLDTAAVREVLAERYAAYAAVTGEPAPPPEGLVSLGEQATVLRAAAQETHLLYSIIDGSAWFRTEGMMPREAVDTQTLTPPAELLLTGEYGLGPETGSAAQRLRAAARACLAESGDSADLVRGLMAATLADGLLAGDHVTLTCPQGDLLATPELMTGSEAFFTETMLAPGLDLGAVAERLGHDSDAQVQRTIRARMLKLKRGAIRGMYGPGCIQGRFVEKHGGHMIFAREDAHYRGHQSIGCSCGGRASFALSYAVAGQERAMTPMVGDYRVVRMSQDPADEFTVTELARVICYAEWIKVVVEETYAAGRIVRADTAVSTGAVA